MVTAVHIGGVCGHRSRGIAEETGRLVQLMRGVYVDAGDDVDATVLRHAVRIARYLYPRAYLSAASAVLLGPTRDGRLFLAMSGVLESLAVVEWLGLALGRAAGFTVPDAALVAMPDSMPPALLVERFDIRESGEDTR